MNSNTLSDPKVQTIVERSLVGKRIIYLLENQYLGKVKDKIDNEPNCHGTVLYLIGEINLPRYGPPEEICDEKLDLRYPRVEETADAIIAVRNGLNNYLAHTGIYLGKVGDKRLVFEQNGKGGEFEFSDFGHFFQEYFEISGQKFNTYNEVSFHRF